MEEGLSARYLVHSELKCKVNGVYSERSCRWRSDKAAIGSYLSIVDFSWLISRHEFHLGVEPFC